MKKPLITLFLGSLLFQGCAQAPEKTSAKKSIEQPKTELTFKLSDFLEENKDLDS